MPPDQNASMSDKNMYNVLMDLEVAHRLTALTKDFYAFEAESFSGTRQHPWNGWGVIASELQKMIDSGQLMDKDKIRVLDIGAGNLRFENYLMQKFGEFELEVVAVDDCPELINDPYGFDLRFLELDIIAELENGSLGTVFSDMRFDLAVAFGIMHHIPVFEWRKDLALILQASLQRNGIAAVSFWQFMRSKRISKLASDATGKAQSELGLSLDASAGDFMLGWQNKPGVYRYCHNFSDKEIDRLIEDGGYNILNDYCSEKGYLNRYVVFDGNID